MKETRRSQAERSATTRASLIAAARPLFAARGFAAVGTPELVAAAGVTRGAMYHHFADKADLFAAVAEAVEVEVTQRIAAGVVAAAPGDPVATIHAAVDAWFDACEDPEARQVLLVDGPVVLGWEGFRDLAQEYYLGLTEQMLKAAIEAGELIELPATPLAHVVIGSLTQAALMIAADPATREDTARVVHALVDGLRTG